MITKLDIPALWLSACPSFGPAYAESCADYGEALIYVHAGDFARHLWSLHRTQQQAEFPAVAACIESLLTEGDHFTREFATIGILEGIQNVSSHTDGSPDEFASFLKPVSAAAWRSLNQFWAGEIPVVPNPLRDHFSSRRDPGN